MLTIGDGASDVAVVFTGAVIGISEPEVAKDSELVVDSGVEDVEVVTLNDEDVGTGDDAVDVDKRLNDKE